MTRAVAVRSEADWHALRRRHVGGSEIAALFGESPYLTRFELWHAKAGTLPEPDLSDNERVQAGSFLEPAIAAWAAHKWDMRIRKVRRYIQHPTVAGMGCSLDYESQEGRLIPVEIKLVDGLVFRDAWEASGDEIKDAPLHILLQAQHQMACTGAPYCWIVACVGGNGLKRMRLERRPKTIALIEREVAAFWREVEEGRPPKPDFAADGATIAALYASCSTGRAVDMTGHNRLPTLCAEYQAAATDEKAAKDRKKAALAEILPIIGDAEKVTCGAYRISASMVAGGVVSYERAPYRNFRLTERKTA